MANAAGPGGIAENVMTPSSPGRFAEIVSGSPDSVGVAASAIYHGTDYLDYELIAQWMSKNRGLAHHGHWVLLYATADSTGYADQARSEFGAPSTEVSRELERMKNGRYRPRISADQFN